ncbi:MAG: hypothetical protein OXI19_13365 [Gemmatimonadota bacterium]|nr:hypothetical protein [Gemmatimonadota bacterium]
MQAIDKTTQPSIGKAIFSATECQVGPQVGAGIEQIGFSRPCWGGLRHDHPESIQFRLVRPALVAILEMAVKGSLIRIRQFTVPGEFQPFLPFRV